MDKMGIMSMNLLKCEGCGLYHFCLGSVTLNLTERELVIMGKIITQAIIETGSEGRDVSKNTVSRRHGNLIN